MFNRKQLWALLIPLIFEEVLTSLLGTVDTMMVSSISSAISAVSLVDSLNVLMIQLFSAMATGGAIICSQYIGRGDKHEAAATGQQLLASITLIAAAIGVFCAVFRTPLLSLIFGQVEADVMRDSRIYLFVTALSFPFLALYSAGAAVYRAHGNSRLPMVISVISNVFNIIGNAVLIYGLHMGVLGVAIPTLLARMFTAVAMLACIRRKGGRVHVDSLLHWRPDLSRIGHILRIGIPTGIENSMFQFGKLVIQSTISTMGTAAIAANAMAAQLENFVSHAPIAMGLGMMTVVGQCIGAGRQDEAIRYTKKLTWYSWGFLLIGNAWMAASVRWITQISGMEQQAADIAVYMTLWIAFYKSLPWTWAFLPAHGMRAAGDVRYSMIVSTISMWVCRVAVVLFLAKTHPGIGPIAMWIGMFTDWTVRAICFYIRFRSGAWLKHQVLKEQNPA